jgi:hypothetical protein
MAFKARFLHNECDFCCTRPAFVAKTAMTERGERGFACSLSMHFIHFAGRFVDGRKDWRERHHKRERNRKRTRRRSSHLDQRILLNTFRGIRMKRFVVACLTLGATGAAHAGRCIPVNLSVPTLGEFAMVGLAVVVGVAGGKLVSKYRRK